MYRHKLEVSKASSIFHNLSYLGNYIGEVNTGHVRMFQSQWANVINPRVENLPVSKAWVEITCTAIQNNRTSCLLLRRPCFNARELVDRLHRLN